jgi:uncharacterized protein (TIGR02285 family)
MKIIIFLSLPFLLFAQTVTIDWYRINFPPSLIYTPNEASTDNNGYSDKARTIVIKNLKEYKHKYLPISIPKVMRLAKKHKTKTVCFAGLNKNKEREEFLLFSQAHLLSLPNQIIARKDNIKIKEFINKDGEISLSKLLRSNFKVSVAEGRSYSSIIDSILKENKNVIKPVSKDISHSYLKQVIANKVDFTIDYPVNINYFTTKGIIVDSSILVSYPISEQSEKIKVYFGCSKKSGEADKIIEKINKIIKNNQNEMTEYYTDNLSSTQKKSY